MQSNCNCARLLLTHDEYISGIFSTNRWKFPIQTNVSNENIIHKLFRQWIDLKQARTQSMKLNCHSGFSVAWSKPCRKFHANTIKWQRTRWVSSGGATKKTHIHLRIHHSVHLERQYSTSVWSSYYTIEMALIQYDCITQSHGMFSSWSFTYVVQTEFLHTLISWMDLGSTHFKSHINALSGKRLAVDDLSSRTYRMSKSLELLQYFLKMLRQDDSGV